MSPDWFSVDKKILGGIVFLLDELARSLRTWENENYVMEYNFFSSHFQSNTYGKYLKANRLGERELKNAMLDRASKDFLDDYINEIERRRSLQHR